MKMVEEKKVSQLCVKQGFICHSVIFVEKVLPVVDGSSKMRGNNGDSINTFQTSTVLHKNRTAQVQACHLFVTCYTVPATGDAMSAHRLQHTAESITLQLYWRTRLTGVAQFGGVALEGRTKLRLCAPYSPAFFFSSNLFTSIYAHYSFCSLTLHENARQIRDVRKQILSLPCSNDECRECLVSWRHLVTSEQTNGYRAAASRCLIQLIPKVANSLCCKQNGNSGFLPAHHKIQFTVRR